MTLLHSLYSYAKAHSLEKEAYFEENEIEWLLRVSSANKFSLERLSGPRKGRGKPYHLPIPLKRTVNILPNMITDNGAYVLGLKFPDERVRSNPNWVADCHEAYVKLLERITHETGDPAVKLVAKFFRNQDDKLSKNPLVTKADISSMDSICPATKEGDEWLPLPLRPKVRNWWRKNYADLQKMKAGEGVCLVSGKQGDLARLHPLVTGIRGGKSTGITLISYNQPSSESFGKSQGDNSPISVDAALLCGKALSRIVSGKSGKRRSIQIAPGVYMGFVTLLEPEEEAADFILSLLDPKETDVELGAAGAEGYGGREVAVWKPYKSLFGAPWKGAKPPMPETPVDMFTVAVRPSSARIEEWDSRKTTFGEMNWHLENYFRHLEMIDPWAGVVRSDFPMKTIWGKDENGKPKPILSGLLDRLKNPNRDEAVDPNDLAALYRAAMTGSPIPMAIYNKAKDAALRCARDGKMIPVEAMALIKAYLNREYTKPHSDLPQRFRHFDPNWKGATAVIDPTCVHAAYLIGRLLAVAERIQEMAIPGVTSSVVKRLFGGISRNPAIHMPSVIRDMNHHLGKIMRHKRGLAIWAQKELVTPIMNLFTSDMSKSFPMALGLPEHGLFTLGYYHQRSDMFLSKKKVEVEPEPELSTS